MWSSLALLTYFHLYTFWTRNKTVHILSSTFFSSILRLFVFLLSLSKWFTGIRLLNVYIHFSSRSKICRKLKISNSWSLLFELLHSTYVHSIFNLYTWSFPFWLKILFDFLLWTWSDRLWEKMFKNPNNSSYDGWPNGKLKFCYLVHIPFFGGTISFGMDHTFMNWKYHIQYKCLCSIILCQSFHLEIICTCRSSFKSTSFMTYTTNAVHFLSSGSLILIFIAPLNYQKSINEMR